MKLIPLLKRVKLISEQWRGWNENTPVMVVGMNKGKAEFFKNLAEAKKKYPDLDPNHNGKRFTNAMREKHGGKDHLRFETWEAYNTLSV